MGASKGGYTDMKGTAYTMITGSAKEGANAINTLSNALSELDNKGQVSNSTVEKLKSAISLLGDNGAKLASDE
jgi:hypothetical protein